MLPNSAEELLRKLLMFTVDDGPLENEVATGGEQKGPRGSRPKALVDGT